MPRPPIDLEPYRAKIIGWRQEGCTREDILERLEAENMYISMATLKKALAGWNNRVHKIKYTQQNEAALRSAIRALYNKNLTDNKTVEILQAMGFDVQVYTVARIRVSMGLQKRMDHRYRLRT
jgi:hypothetical protein